MTNDKFKPNHMNNYIKCTWANHYQLKGSSYQRLKKKDPTICC